ncbi:GNAT family N-acetyltransferase [Nocardioides aquiterrae]|uniref:GNAT family protein n=1 Tax=Nocardioides aquiterrae TaxID=203799 RepID=A0ABP4EZN4_9ACTN
MLPDGYELRPLRQGDSAALAAAYRRNREHLAPWDPARPERFFTDEGHAEEVAKQLEATAEDRRHAFVLWYGDVVAGRVNIDNIVRGVLQSCTLGYWLDHEHLGKGLATEMVAFAVERAREIGLHRVEAGTLLHNTRSQAVLQRAGFEEFGVAENLLFIAGKWQDHVLFQRILHDEPLGNPQTSTIVQEP